VEVKVVLELVLELVLLLVLDSSAPAHPFVIRDSLFDIRYSSASNA